MKKHFKYLLGAFAVCSLAMTSCSDDDNPDPYSSVQIDLNDCDIDYNENLVWNGWDKEGDLNLRGFIFSHSLTEWGTCQGFTAAAITENDKPDNGIWYDSAAQFEVMPRGGVFGIGSPYLVAYWNSSETAKTPITERSCMLGYSGIDAEVEFQPVYVKVTNTAYDYYSMSEGDSFAKKFENGDWLKLIAHGVAADGSEKTAEFYLADMDNGGIITDWQLFDLTPLGTVQYIYFTMESSDTGQLGMNTPSYFALDQFTAKMTNY